MEIILFTINEDRIWKYKKTIELNDYKYCKASGITEFELFHKESNKVLRLNTIHCYETIINQYDSYKNSDSFSDIMNKDNTINRVYNKDILKERIKEVDQNTYIKDEDFVMIYKQFRMWNNETGNNIDLLPILKEYTDD